MDEPRARGGRRARDDAGALGLHRLKSLPAAFEQYADEIDDDCGVAGRGLDRFRITHVGLNGVDLSDAPERLEMTREIGPAYRDANAIVPLRQRPHHVAAQEPGAAENRHEGFVGGHSRFISRRSCPVWSTGSRAVQSRDRGR